MLPIRPISPSLLAPPPFDPPRLIQEAMGGRQFFFDIGARAIHRVGLLLGLAWRLPFGEARDGIDFVRIVVEQVRLSGIEDNFHQHLTFDMRFSRIRQFDGDGCARFAEWAAGNPQSEADLAFVRRRFHVPLSGLLEAYHTETGAVV